MCRRGQAPAHRGDGVGRALLVSSFRGQLGFGSLDDRRVVRDPLLQQQLDGANHRLGMKPARHHIVEQRVGQGHQAHPLVVGHVRPHDDAPLALGQAVGRVVDRLVEAISALGSLLGQAAQVFQGLARCDHRGHGRGVGGDDPVLVQSLLEPQSRHAERLVVIIAVGVLGGVCRLGDAPGKAQLLAVLDLPRHGRAARLGQQRAGQAAQQQPGHQVLEHRPAPGDQADPARHADEVPAKLEPVAARGLAPRDGQVARQAGFRGQQVVAGVVELSLRQVEADREEVAIGPVQRPEVHAGGEGLGTVGQARADQHSADRLPTAAAEPWMSTPASSILQLGECGELIGRRRRLGSPGQQLRSRPRSSAARARAFCVLAGGSPSQGRPRPARSPRPDLVHQPVQP